MTAGEVESQLSEKAAIEFFKMSDCNQPEVARCPYMLRYMNRLNRSIYSAIRSRGTLPPQSQPHCQSGSASMTPTKFEISMTGTAAQMEFRCTTTRGQSRPVRSRATAVVDHLHRAIAHAR